MSLPVGDPVSPLQPSPLLMPAVLSGASVTLRPPDPAADTPELYEASHGDPASEEVWTYMGYGPFADRQAMADWIETTAMSADPLWFTAEEKGGKPIGMAAFMNADPIMRRLEIGHIWYIPYAHRTGANTEVAYLMLKEAFTTYRSRRVEWKCDSLNAASRHAATRLGFTFEGVFHNHMIVKGRNRDTAWYAMYDDDWPRVQVVLEHWLDHPDPKPSLSEGMLQSLTSWYSHDHSDEWADPPS